MGLIWWLRLIKLCVLSPLKYSVVRWASYGSGRRPVGREREVLCGETLCMAG